MAKTDTARAHKEAMRVLELRKLAAEAEQAEIEAQEALANQERRAELHRIRDATDSQKTGRFVFHREVDPGSTQWLRNELDEFNRIYPGEPIVIEFSTPGGSVIDGLALYDAIRSFAGKGHHVTTLVRGYAASMGSILLQAGDKRVMGPESFIMIHEVSSLAWGKLHEMRDSVEFSEKLNRRLFEILASRSSKWTGSRLYTKCKAKDYWLSATESVAQGFADEVEK